MSTFKDYKRALELLDSTTMSYVDKFYKEFGFDGIATIIEEYIFEAVTPSLILQLRERINDYILHTVKESEKVQSACNGSSWISDKSVLPKTIKLSSWWVPAGTEHVKFSDIMSSGENLECVISTKMNMRGIANAIGI